MIKPIRKEEKMIKKIKKLLELEPFDCEFCHFGRIVNVVRSGKIAYNFECGGCGTKHVCLVSGTYFKRKQ